ncbi:MAG: hypothetical protein ABW164_05260, partial [Sphingobium sp.]
MLRVTVGSMAAALMITSGLAHAQPVEAAADMGGMAITSGQYDAAIGALKSSAGRDAGKLINLANAYAGKGLLVEARRTYQAAIHAQSYDVTLADGRTASTRSVAMRGLSLLP